MFRIQCRQLPVPPWTSTSGAPLPQMCQTTSPAPFGVVRRVLARSTAATVSAGITGPGVASREYSCTLIDASFLLCHAIAKIVGIRHPLCGSLSSGTRYRLEESHEILGDMIDVGRVATGKLP